MRSLVPLAPEDWIEKRFSFDAPIGAFPAVLERVRGTPARLEELVRSLPPDVLVRNIGDSWSIQEHVGHLNDLDGLHEGRLDDYDAGLAVLRAADMTNRKTYEANYNSRPLEELLDAFRSSRGRFVTRLAALGVSGANRSALHPRLQQQLRVIDLALFVADHDDHHLASIRFLADSFSHQDDMR